jgi:DNA-binding CsgD family transcriptional regulator
VMRLGRAALTLSLNGEYVILSLNSHSRSSGLPPRERTAAMLFAAGHSYKEIAKILLLTPATVRTYLRNSYQQLGVSSKVELGYALRMSPTSVPVEQRN